MSYAPRLHPVPQDAAGAHLAVIAAVQRKYARLAARYEQRWSAYVTTSVRATLRRLALRPQQRVLDVGCGTGELLQAMRSTVPSLALTGIDLSAEMLQVASRKLGPDFALAAANAEELPFAAAAFDVVVSTSSLHYWPRPALALAAMAAVLRPGGAVVITDWCSDFLACRVCDLVLRLVDPAFRGALGRADCARLLALAGYEEPQIERYRVQGLWGLMTATATRPAP